MFAIFSTAVAPVPAELKRIAAVPVAAAAPIADVPARPAIAELDAFRAAAAAKGESIVSFFFGDDEGALACGSNGDSTAKTTAEGGAFVVFDGRIHNAGELKERYGFRSTEEVSNGFLAIEMYKMVRDRHAFPLDHSLRYIRGDYSLVLYDASTNRNVFVARGSKHSPALFWGIGKADGNVRFASDASKLQAACPVVAEFPAGAYYTSHQGLRSYEEPSHKLRAVPKVDAAGVVVGIVFEIDMESRIDGGLCHALGSELELRTGFAV